MTVKIKITAGGIYGADGEVPIGTVFTLPKKPAGWEGRYEVISGDEDEDGGAGAKTAVTADAPAEPLTAVDQGGGWWAITDANGKAWGKKMRADDAEVFNALSDEDKAKHLAAD
jgi:hypothetical protein